MEPIFTLNDKAIAAGGAKAGEYLERIGKTDLAKLTAEEWAQFCKTLVFYAFRDALDQHVGRIESGEIDDSEVPF